MSMDILYKILHNHKIKVLGVPIKMSLIFQR